MTEKNPEERLSSSLLSETNEWALTIAPDDEHQFWGDPDRVGRFMRKVLPVLADICQYVDNLILFLEVSRGGRLHLHGWFSFSNTIEFFLYVPSKLKMFGRYEMDTIEDQEYWKSYCTKDQEITNWADYFKETILPYPLSKRKIEHYKTNVTEPQIKRDRRIRRHQKRLDIIAHLDEIRAQSHQKMQELKEGME